MEQSKLMPEEAKEHVEANTMEALGHPEQASGHSTTESTSDAKMDDLPAYAKERLGRQEKRHQREMRSLRDQLAQVQANQSNPGMQAQPMQMQQQQQANMGGMQGNGGGMQGMSGGMQGMQGQPQQPMSMQDAVSAELNRRDQVEQAKHLQKQYSTLNSRLDAGSNKYDDFDDVVRNPDVPFTSHMRDASLVIPNPEDVLYKLGKNPDELSRISKLHPLEQAKEMVKLSVALLSGNGGNQSQTPKTLSNVKNNPMNVAGVNENTSVSDLRKQMKGWRK